MYTHVPHIFIICWHKRGQSYWAFPPDNFMHMCMILLNMRMTWFGTDSIPIFHFIDISAKKLCSHKLKYIGMERILLSQRHSIL